MIPADRAAWPKPLDVGNGQVCASFAVDGSWLSLGRPEPRHGFVEAAGTEFDESWRGRPDLVRRYRHELTLARRSAVRVLGAATVAPVDGRLPAGAGLRWAGSGPSGSRAVEAWAVDGEPVVAQRHALTADPDSADTEVTVQANVRLTRPAYAEITEVDPPAPLPGRQELCADGATLWIGAPDLPARSALRVTVDGGSSPGWLVDGSQARLVVGWSPRRATSLVLTLAWSLALDDHAQPVAPITPAPAPTGRPTEPQTPAPSTTRLHLPAPLEGRLERIVDGTLRYVLGCTALEVAPGRRTIVTDHRLLQLSWTRDAYYQALLLLAARDRDPRALSVVAEHLGWLWETCERDAGRWMRSHLTNGAVKDRVFQADQQLYPVLELLDHRDVAGRWAPVPGGATSWGPLVRDVWRNLPVDPHRCLVTGAENPADDPAGLPYLLSSQILLWRTAVRLDARAAELGVQDLGLADFAVRLWRSVLEHFTVDGPLGRQWAYETDGAGRHRLYQDANDLPTALAPLWGFCAADSEEWSTTMRFACSAANPGWSSGPLGGLGSLHTPGTWPLGDVQEWVAASLLGDTDRATAVLTRLAAVAAPDGLLPETYDSMTGAWRARHWFAWPSAVLGALVLGAGEGLVPAAS